LRILLDQNVPIGVRALIGKDHDVTTAYEEGLSTLSDAELLDAADANGFDILVTCDRSMPHQQNMTGRRVELRVLWTTRWLDLVMSAERVREVILG
jgi:predicted nuclease of predicted toxin-antitoxin system